MPTRKISDTSIWCKKNCNHPEHNPPSMRVFEPGTYEHECPSCGSIQIFTVPAKPELRTYGRKSDPEIGYTG